ADLPAGGVGTSHAVCLLALSAAKLRTGHPPDVAAREARSHVELAGELLKAAGPAPELVKLLGEADFESFRHQPEIVSLLRPPPPRRRYSTLDSSVGYIDNPIPTDQVILRYDTAYDSPTPNRAEFFYAKPRPGGPGLPRPERRIDFQDVTAVLEAARGERWSG